MKCPKCGVFISAACHLCGYGKKEKKVPQPLKRTPLPPPTKPIPKMSDKYKKRNKVKIEAYDEVDSKGICWCESCGRTDRPLSHSHILPVGQYPKFEAVPENIILECFGSSDSCHEIWEHGTIENKMKLLTWARKVEVIIKYAPSYLDLLMKNHNTI